MLNKQTLISIEDALPGRDQPMQIDDHHFVNKSNLKAPLTSHQQQILLGMGCFGALSAYFGNSTALYLLRSVTLGGTHPIPPMKKSVRVKRVIQKSYESFSMNASSH